MKKPSDMNYVPLSEALTWIAFQDAIAPNELSRQLEGPPAHFSESPDQRVSGFFISESSPTMNLCGSGYFHDRPAGLDQLVLAWNTLRELVNKGVVSIQGRYSRTFNKSDACISHLIDLEAKDLETFSQFDATSSGIRRKPEGSPHIIWRDHEQSFEREIDALTSEDGRLSDGFLFVQVHRGSLMAAFPALETPSPSVISMSNAERECALWLRAAFATDPDHRKSKADFRAEALAQFAGRISMRAFNDRIWPPLAKAFGRAAAGRKRSNSTVNRITKKS